LERVEDVACFFLDDLRLKKLEVIGVFGGSIELFKPIEFSTCGEIRFNKEEVFF
jgi:hypothetical protein